MGGALATANAVWGPSYDNAFAVTGASAILRFNGSSWSQVAGAGGALLDIGGVGSSHALAIGADLRTMRWNGTAWSQVASFAPTATQFPEAGSAVPGFGVIVGNNATAWTATAGQPFRMPAGRR